MTVQLLAQNILTDAHFISAGSQASGFWGQPLPGAANTGKFRLLSQGDAADFSYSGTTSSNGNVGGTTAICATLMILYGDDFFIGATLAITSGACSGESKTVSDYVRGTGTLTVSAAFTAQIVNGVTFTLTIPFATRTFQAELIAGGDAGDATFKWNHNGSTWLGRRTTPAMNWQITDGVLATGRISVCQAADQSVIVAYNDDAANAVKCKRSTDLGLSFGAAITISASDRQPQCMVALKSGRVMVFMGQYMSYSDDYGLTWSAEQLLSLTLCAVIELNSGVLFAVRIDSVSDVDGALSPDGGFSWTNIDGIFVGTAGWAACAQARNGDIVVVYDRDEGSSHYEICCKISENNGSTWGSEYTIFEWTATSWYNPTLIRDIDGQLWVYTYYDSADQAIVSAYSDDNGATWAAGTDGLTVAGSDLRYPSACLVDGHIRMMVCVDHTLGRLYATYVGAWEAYSANGCPAAIDALPQRLVCGAELVWHGSGGVVADTWTFGPEYDFSMENLIADSPSRPWRTAADGADYAVVLDLGTNARFFADGVAFFGCNVRQVTFQMNATDSWGSPSVDKDVDFTLTTGGAVDASGILGNAVKDTSLMANYADHQLKGYYLRMLDGTDIGVTWKILDNVGDWILLDTTAANNIAVADTFCIFGTKAAGTFTAGVFRFCRILVENQQTAENYYQVGYAALGRMTSLDRGIASGFGRTRQANVEMLRTPAGGMIPIRGADPKNVFELTFPDTDLGRRQLISMLDAQRGQNMVLIPDSADLLDVHLVKAVSDARQTHVFLDGYNVVLTLEEVL